MKAILVIDEMPKDCDECPLNSTGYCDVLQEYVWLNEWVEDAPYYSLMEKGDCPLKPMPQKKEAFEECMKFGMMTDKISEAIVWQVQGYNCCIDEILGGNK